jgi:hypothetical protein
MKTALSEIKLVNMEELDLGTDLVSWGFILLPRYPSQITMSIRQSQPRFSQEITGFSHT